MISTDKNLLGWEEYLSLSKNENDLYQTFCPISYDSLEEIDWNHRIVTRCCRTSSDSPIYRLYDLYSLKSSVRDIENMKCLFCQNRLNYEELSLIELRCYPQVRETRKISRHLRMQNVVTINLTPSLNKF